MVKKFEDRFTHFNTQMWQTDRHRMMA